MASTNSNSSNGSNSSNSSNSSNNNNNNNLKPYWVFEEVPEKMPCQCCDPGHAMHEDYWTCSVTEQKWRILSEEPDMTKPHTSDLCMGNCAFHPLCTRHTHTLMHAELYQTTWGDYSAELEAALLALETASQKASRLVREALKAQEDVINKAASLCGMYSRKMQDQAMRGVKKNEGPKKYDKPCRWMIGRDAAESASRGEKPCCWAWEYKDPKTKKNMTPRTCPFQHPGEPGWHNEWLSNPRFNPSTAGGAGIAVNTVEANRFMALAPKRNRF